MGNAIDEAVYRYRESNDPREKNKLFIKIADVYMPRVYTLMQTFDKRWHDDILSTYYMFVLRAIDKWEGRSLFTTYLYPYTGIKLKSEVMEKYVMKSRREQVFTDLSIWEYDDE